ncbi:MAG: hypothetical protein H7318_09705 [Oligoflexus sp.]|nr:hypothetical protein [Oligoflexus sp.]
MWTIHEVKFLLHKLSLELWQTGGKSRYQICLLGEMSMVFEFGIRKSVSKVEARLSYETDIIYAARKVAIQHGFDKDWLVANHSIFDPPDFKEIPIDVPGVDGFLMTRPNAKLLFFLKAYFYDRERSRDSREEMIELGRLLGLKSSSEAQSFLLSYPDSRYSNRQMRIRTLS